MFKAHGPNQIVCVSWEASSVMVSATKTGYQYFAEGLSARNTAFSPHWAFTYPWVILQRQRDGVQLSAARATTWQLPAAGEAAILERRIFRPCQVSHHSLGLDSTVLCGLTSVLDLLVKFSRSGVLSCPGLIFIPAW